MSGLYQKTYLNSASGIAILLVYEHGGYSHPVHPVDASIAPTDILNKTHQILEIYSQAIQIIRRKTSRQEISSHDILSAIYYRLDRMEEKDFDDLDTLHRLHLTQDQLPAVVMLKGRFPPISAPSYSRWYAV